MSDQHRSNKRQTIERFYRLKEVLYEISKSLNLDKASDRDLWIYYALFELSKEVDGRAITAQMVSEHPRCVSLSSATLYRSLTFLCEQDAIKCTDSHPKHYWIDGV